MFILKNWHFRNLTKLILFFQELSCIQASWHHEFFRRGPSVKLDVKILKPATTKADYRSQVSKSKRDKPRSGTEFEEGISDMIGKYQDMKASQHLDDLKQGFSCLQQTSDEGPSERSDAEIKAYATAAKDWWKHLPSLKALRSGIEERNEKRLVTVN